LTVVAPAKLLASKVSKRFGALLALDGIDLSLPEGQFTAFVGPSGCGKTTFLRIVAGLVRASDGEVRIDGQLIDRPSSDRGFVFQTDNLLPWRNILANARLGHELNGTTSNQERQHTLALLKLVGLGGFESHYPAQLSGGMRQRVNLARALAIDPKLLLMDEPFSALDAQTREIMQTELLRIWEQGRKTVLFVTHQIDEAIFLSDQIVVFARNPGRIKEIINIDLPRPRELSVKRTPAFAKHVDHIWSLIEHDVRETALTT
jgi:NitT/TauT family transport system ATP-binding protein